MAEFKHISEPLRKEWERLYKNYYLMANFTNIEWCDHTDNLWWGCAEVHRGCDNCYARIWANRFKKQSGGSTLWGYDQPRRLIKGVWGDFVSQQNKAKKAGKIARVFVGSMMDIFENNKTLINEKGEKVAHPNAYTTGPNLLTTGHLRTCFFNDVVPNSPNLEFLLLTKRPSNILKMIPPAWFTDPPENVIFGASIVDKKSLSNVWGHMSKVTRAGFRTFWSVEPLLEEIDPLQIWEEAINHKGPIKNIFLPDWIICGGESGPNRRPFEADWARVIRDFCESTATPFFMKQIDKVLPIPEDLQIRQFPEHTGPQKMAAYGVGPEDIERTNYSNF
jgi:protein gp37